MQKQQGEAYRQSDKKDYLHNELRSLGIHPKRKNKNDLNHAEDLEYLTDAIKQSLYQDYRIAYSENGDVYEEEARSTVHI
jgi:hypothetical protein